MLIALLLLLAAVCGATMFIFGKKWRSIRRLRFRSGGDRRTALDAHQWSAEDCVEIAAVVRHLTNGDHGYSSGQHLPAWLCGFYSRLLEILGLQGIDRLNSTEALQLQRLASWLLERDGWQA